MFFVTFVAFVVACALREKLDLRPRNEPRLDPLDLIGRGRQLPLHVLRRGRDGHDPESRALLRQASYGVWRFLEPSEKASDGIGVTDALLIAFFSVITAGILPAIVWSQYSARKRRLKGFFQLGTPAVARVIGMDSVDLGFDRKMMRVQYEFIVEGRRIVDFDQVLPSIAKRWDAGTVLRILYRADRDFDSAIIGTA